MDMIDELLKAKLARLTFAITPANKQLNIYETFSQDFGQFARYSCRSYLHCIINMFPYFVINNYFHLDLHYTHHR